MRIPTWLRGGYSRPVPLAAAVEGSKGSVAPKVAQAETGAAKALSSASDVIVSRRGSSGSATPVGRASWDTGYEFLGKLNKVPNEQGFAIYAALREAVPAINAMILRMRGFIGCPEFVGDDETVKELNDFLKMISVNRSQHGFSNWLNSWVDTALSLGRAHTEIILNRDASDIFALSPLSPRTIRMVPSEDGYGIRYYQQQTLGKLVELVRELLLTAIHDSRDDQPDGHAMIWGLPLVGEIVAKMFTDQGLIWDRYGVPRYHIAWEPEADFHDPGGEESKKVLAEMGSNFNTGLKNAQNGSIGDFYTSGKVKVTVIGAEGATLNLEIPLRALLEQIVAVSGLPPYVFGYSWSTTERMTAVQAGSMTAVIEEARNEIEAEIFYFIQLRQALGGRDRDIAIKWPRLTLMDRTESAKADLLEEQSEAQCFANAMRMWQSGALTRYEFVREVREDLEEADDATIDARLPNLPLVAPSASLANVGDSAGSSSGSSNGNQPILTGNGLYGLVMRGWK